MAELRVSTFRVGDLLLGLDVERVAEVVSDVGYVPVPGSHDGIAGIMNLRGRLLTVFDARRRLGIARDTGSGGFCVHLVVQTEGGAASVLVDQALEVLNLSDAVPDELPATIDPWLRSLTTQSFQTPQGLLLVLDPDALLDVSVNPRNES